MLANHDDQSCPRQRIVGSCPCQRTYKHHRQGVSRANKVDILGKSEKNSPRERVILRETA